MSYTKNDICAVIVSYNPTDVIINNIESLLPQVNKCVRVDNCSGNINRLVDTLKTKNYAVDFILLDDNYGISYALNRAHQYCVVHDYKLMLTMDQDTVLKNDAVSGIAQSYQCRRCKFGLNKLGSQN